MSKQKETAEGRSLIAVGSGLLPDKLSEIGIATAPDDSDTLLAMLTALAGYSREDQIRLLRSAATFFGVAEEVGS